MRTVETVEFAFTPEELEALAQGQQLQAALGDKRALFYVIQPDEQEKREREGPDSPDEIQEGAEVDAE